VSRSEKENGCHAGHAISLPGPHGFISSKITAETNAGSITCPWRVEAAPGQHINITLINLRVQYGNMANKKYGYITQVAFFLTGLVTRFDFLFKTCHFWN